MTSVPAPTPQRPDAVVFDVVETLFSLDAVGAALDRAGVGAGLLDLFFARMLRDAFALGSVDEYRPFRELAGSALTVVAPSLGPDDVDTVLGAFGDLGMHPDVAPAVARLQQADIRIAALTNGSATNTQRLLEQHGVADAFEAIVSVDEVRTWKPRPAPYRYVADRLGLDRHRVAMVAVHAWDLHGARRAGLLTGWAGRLEHTWTEVFAAPDVTGWDLVDVVDELLALPDDTAQTPDAS
ncbi:MAG: haloacid dehalogenase type II [Ilumatobacteraceae bacterium]